MRSGLSAAITSVGTARGPDKSGDEAMGGTRRRDESLELGRERVQCVKLAILHVIPCYHIDYVVSGSLPVQNISFQWCNVTKNMLILRISIFTVDIFPILHDFISSFCNTIDSLLFPKHRLILLCNTYTTDPSSYLKRFQWFNRAIQLALSKKKILS